jgi:tetratricopeptide (TPR) repeat protein
VSTSNHETAPNPADEQPVAGAAGPPAQAGAQPSLSAASPESLSADSPAAGADDQIEEYEPLTPELVEEEAIRNDFMLRGAVVFLALVVGSTVIGETATLLHVKTGQYLASHGILPPAHDVFSYTAADRPWTNLSWGFDLLAAAFYALGGFVGLSIVKALLSGIIFFLLMRVSRPGLPTWWGSICAALAVLACSERLTLQPTLITNLGVVLVLWIVHDWRQQGAQSKQLWLLTPLFLLWSNLDSRAFLGLALLVLFAAGDLVGRLLKAASALTGAARKQLWLVTAASVGVTVIHPFGLKSLLSPLLVYGVEYPAMRDYILQVHLGSPGVPRSGPALIWFPMTAWAFWENLDMAAMAALALFVLAGLLLVLNYARMEWGHLAMFSGVAVLAVLCLHELPAAALVAGAVATLGGQSWYAATFRQTYTVATGELLLSRGGRVMTVLALAALALFMGTGRLRDASSAKSGFGLAPALETDLADLKTRLEDDKSYDHRPFNLTLSLGDKLIWVGDQVFADTRVAIYHAPEKENNLLAAHQTTRQTFHPQRDSGLKGSGSVARRRVWKSTFDRHEITHIVVPMSQPSPDYEAMFELLKEDGPWTMTALGSAAAVFYRQTDDEELEKFIESNAMDFRELAYRREDDAIKPHRGRWVRPPSFYQRYFWSPERAIPGKIQEGFHLIQLATAPQFPKKWRAHQDAIALLAIRRAQQGLVEDPDCSAGYFVLGLSYQLLAHKESFYMQNQSVSPFTGMRYFQAVAAFNQTLVNDPEFDRAHLSLASLYQSANRPDLTLRHLEAVERLWQNSTRASPEEKLQITRRLEDTQTYVAQMEERIASNTTEEVSPLQKAQMYMSQGFVAKALDELERGNPQNYGRPENEIVRIFLLLESGQVERAHTAAEQFAAAAETSGIKGWADPVAFTNLADGNHEAAALALTRYAETLSKNSSSKLLLTMPPRPAGRNAAPWPIMTTQSAMEHLYQDPEQIAGATLNAALIYLEIGQLKSAETYFRHVLAVNPETRARTLVALYLLELTGKDDIDPLPPSERIPELFAPEAEPEAEPASEPEPVREPE